MATRDAYMEQYYPEIADNDWHDQSSQIATQTNFAEYSRARRLELIRRQEAVDQGETTRPMFTWTWSDATEGPMPFYPSMSPSPGAQYFFRGSYDLDCVWNLADNTVIYRGEANIGNALRSLCQQTVGGEMPGAVHRADGCTAMHPQRSSKEGEGPKEERGDEDGGQHGKGGTPEGYHDSSLCATPVQGAAGGVGG